MYPNLSTAKSSIAAILEKSLSGHEITAIEGTKLLQTTGSDLEAVKEVANYLRYKTKGNRTSFVVTRNINFTNVCYMGCRFCGFAKDKDSAEAELLPLETIALRAVEAWQRGATEVCIQGGLHPDISGEHYRNIILAIKAAVPDIHVHGFSPFEIYYGSRKSRLSYGDFLQDLKECGLGSVPGTAAEILDTEVRKILTKNKLSAAAWVEIIKAAHKEGLPSTSTMMYGHVDQPHHWASHIALLREIQKETGGFTEFVPLGFVHYDSPLYVNQDQLAAGIQVRPGPSWRENLLVHAVARIMLHGHIDNIQVSWVKMGPEFAREAQSFGVNDLGGTLMNESISRAAGAHYGQEITVTEMHTIIQQAGFESWQRNTLYQPVTAANNEWQTLPLVPRNEWQSQLITTCELIG